MIRVTFYAFSKFTGHGYMNTETHKSMEDARLRAAALNWTIVKTEREELKNDRNG